MIIFKLWNMLFQKDPNTKEINIYLILGYYNIGFEKSNNIFCSKTWQQKFLKKYSKPKKISENNY